MTFSEAHEHLDVFIDKHDLPWFEPEEKDIVLNYVQNEYVKMKHKDFEVDEKGRQDLRTLIVSQTGSGSSVSLPADFLFVLNLKGTFSVTNCGVTKTLPNKLIQPVQYDDINKTEEDPFNKADNENPLYLTEANTLSIQSDTAPSAWTLNYLKRPDVVNGTNFPNSSFNLPEHTHEEIVNWATKRLLAMSENPSYPVYLNELKNND
jgi:hypothetical protein